MTTLKDSPTILLFHAEMIPPITDSVGDDVQTSLPPLAPKGALDSYNAFLMSRPPAFETYAIEEILSLAHLAPNLQLHIVHLSAIEAIPLLRAARESGIKISAETCFHYLTLASEEVADGDTRHKCCPPIRSAINRSGLWAELLRKHDSVIETIVSDHSPCTPELKLLPDHLANLDMVRSATAEEKGDFFASWGGISSVGLGLPILWTSAHANAMSPTGAVSIIDVVKWCCVNTAKQVGLDHLKGKIARGMDADFCVFDDVGEFILGKAEMLFRNKVSPYQGRKLKGIVKATYVRGQTVYTKDVGFAKGMPTGKLLLEKRIA